MIKIVNSVEFKHMKKSEAGYETHENPHNVFKKYRDIAGVKIYAHQSVNVFKQFGSSPRLPSTTRFDKRWKEDGADDIFEFFGFKGRKEVFIVSSKRDMLSIPRNSFFIGPKYDYWHTKGFLQIDGKILIIMHSRLYCFENAAELIKSDVFTPENNHQGDTAWLDYRQSDGSGFIWACDRHFNPIHLKRDRFLRSPKEPKYDHYGQING